MSQAGNSVMFVAHGGGPLPLMRDPDHRSIVDGLRTLASEVPSPDAIVVVSAHWEADQPTVTAHPNPPLIFDYSGFPPETYQYQYPAAGHPELATQIQQTLQGQGINAQSDATRGWDHGVFVPLMLMYPDASIPVVQLSLNGNLSPQDHVAVGKALGQLPDQNLLIVGSGFSFHNMRAFFSPPSAEGQRLNQAFEAWLADTLTNPAICEDERERRLVDWEQAAGARYAQPREEHLLPLHVAYGAAGRAADAVVPVNYGPHRASAFYWKPQLS